MCALYDVFDSSFVFQPCLWCQRTHIVNAVKYSDPCDLDSGQSSSAHRNRPFLKGTDGSYSECLCVIVRRCWTKMEARKKVIVLQTVTFSLQVKVKFSRLKNN